MFLSRSRRWKNRFSPAEIPAGEQEIPEDTAEADGQSAEDEESSADISVVESETSTDAEVPTESHAQESAVTFSNTEESAESPASEKETAAGPADASGEQISSFEEAAKQAAKETQSGIAETVVSAPKCCRHGRRGGSGDGEQVSESDRNPQSGSRRFPAGIPGRPHSD